MGSLSCHRTTVEGTTSFDAAPSHAPSASASAVDVDRTLALAPIVDPTPDDATLVAARARAEKIGAEDELSWVMLGRAWVLKARRASDPGFYLDADACARLALKLAPEDPIAAGLHTMVLLNDHRFAQARDAAQVTLKARPDDVETLGMLSDALNELGDVEGATRAVDKMLEIKPGLAAFSRASYLRWLHGDFTGAREMIRQAIDAGRGAKDHEPVAWVIVQAAMIFWHRGDYEGADKGFDLALTLVSDYPPALVGKGRVAMARSDFKTAAADFDAAHRRSPLIETSWLLGDAREQAGDAEGARAAFGEVVRVGRLADGRTLAQFFSAKNRDTDEAIERMETERKGRGDLYTDDAWAWALHRKGRDVEAKAAIDHALTLGTRDARLVFHRGAIRVALGDLHGVDDLHDALTLNPAFDRSGVAEAHALLDASAGTKH